MTLLARDAGLELDHDVTRVVAQLFLPGESIAPMKPQAELIAERVRALAPEQARQIARDLLDAFGPRHPDLEALFARNADYVLGRIGEHMESGSAHHTVMGGTVTNEYSVEGAALCNPSIAPHPDQAGLLDGQLRVVVSLRQIGEGHISSLGFVTGVIGPGESFTLESRHTPLVTPTITSAEGRWSSYRAEFPPQAALSQRVLMPVIDDERNGIEDARLVLFTYDDGSTEYRATYTAYNGRSIIPRLLTSRDLLSFESHPLTGPAATNKGIAPFPRPIKGELYALVRSDGETNGLAHSPDGLAWGRETAIRGPVLPWEIVKSGNCGSPIETDEGWLVITHGVGPMRVYSMGAMLLDLDDPRRVISVLPEPMIRSTGAMQPGYVPNVVYSCGGILHDGVVWLPHGVGDNRIRVASVGLTELLDAMVAV
ncbi:MAG TPA: glycoside hydrolase family 130 protein [Rhodoglobus sp.]|nr:glycoside hydrolase family 130 protein [Rhodoglobus sp.]